MEEGHKIRIKVKKKKINIRRIIILFVFLCLFSYISYYLINRPITNIYITGNHILSDKEIITLAKVDDYPSYILTSTTRLVKRLLQNEYIKNVDIKRTSFHKIYIKITEYHLLCIEKDTDKVILENGIKLDNHYNITNLPFLINNVDKDIYKNFISSFSKIDQDVLSKISEIHYMPVEVDKKRFLLYIDDSNYVYINLDKISEVNKYNEIKAKLEGNLGTLYLDSGNYFELR